MPGYLVRLALIHISLTILAMQQSTSIHDPGYRVQLRRKIAESIRKKYGNDLLFDILDLLADFETVIRRRSTNGATYENVVDQNRQADRLHDKADDGEHDLGGGSGGADPKPQKALEPSEQRVEAEGDGGDNEIESIAEARVEIIPPQDMPAADLTREEDAAIAASQAAAARGEFATDEQVAALMVKYS